MKTPFSFEKNLKRWINLISALNYVTQEPLAEYTIAGRKPVQIDLTLNDGQVISVSWFLSRSEPVLVVGERVYHLSATDEQLLEQGLDVLMPAGVGSVKK